MEAMKQGVEALESLISFVASGEVAERPKALAC